MKADVDIINTPQLFHVEPRTIGSSEEEFAAADRGEVSQARIDQINTRISMALQRLANMDTKGHC